MAEHTVTVKVPMPMEIERTDCVIRVEEDGKVLGKLLISKGSVDWVPRDVEVNAISYTWANFAEVLSTSDLGKAKRLNKKAPKKKAVKKKTIKSKVLKKMAAKKSTRAA